MKKVVFWVCICILALSSLIVQAEPLENVSVGETLTFGHYEQGDGQVPIEWIVLDCQEDRILLLSKYALDCQPYHTVEDWDITWETCTLRSWLNTDFFANAFNADESSRILTVTNVNSNPNEDSDRWVDGGNDTEDRIFLLSSDEVNAYLPSDESRITEATEYAVTQGGRVSRSTGKTYWWLRTPGGSQDQIQFVSYTGEVASHGDSMEAVLYTVRPALWLSLDAQ